MFFSTLLRTCVCASHIHLGCVPFPSTLSSTFRITHSWKKHVPYFYPPCSLLSSFPNEKSRGPALSLDTPVQPGVVQPGCCSPAKASARPLFYHQCRPPLTHGGTSLSSSAAATSRPLKADEACARVPRPGCPLPPESALGLAPGGARGRRQRQQCPLAAGAQQPGRRRSGWKTGAEADVAQRQSQAAGTVSGTMETRCGFWGCAEERVLLSQLLTALEPAGVGG